MFRVCTVNMNAYRNLAKCMSGSVPDSDLVMMQETRLSAARTTDAETELRRRGWRRAAGAPAVPSEAGGLATGGLLTSSRMSHGLAPTFGSPQQIVREGLAVALHLA
eukprot:7155948-Pyramimonas_sp.AAC.1